MLIIVKCKDCQRRYSPQKEMDNAPHFIDAPYHYWRGSDDFCLACWLGVSELTRNSELGNWQPFVFKVQTFHAV
jgi:hypothetical protein